MAEFTVVIQMQQQTVEELVSGRYSLYGLKAVRAYGTGEPTVWFSTDEYSLQTEVSWADQYQAYASTSVVMPNGQITATSTYDIQPGQTLTVQKDGTGSVSSTGEPAAITIYNSTTTEFTCGISQRVDGGAFTPVCAIPLYGLHMEAIWPTDKVFLVFSDVPVPPGTVLTHTYSQGILVDLTGESERTVSYDINQGWTWEGGGPWATTYPAGTYLTPVLIEQPD